MIARDTRGVALDEAQRCNHFPAAPTCALLWYLHGHGELLATAAATETGIARTPIGRISFCGPFTRPTLSRNPGPVHAFMVLLMPDAVTRLTGIDLTPLVDRIVPVETLLDDDWLGLCNAVTGAADDHQRVALIEAFVLPRWRQLRPHASQASHRLSDWANSLALNLATSGLGRSARQAQRRLKRWTAQTQRELRLLGRAERAFFGGVAAHRDGRVDWAELADRAGYSDQAHFSRECRRVTGLSPEALRRRVASDEAFWAYRLWGLDLDFGSESTMSTAQAR